MKNYILFSTLICTASVAAIPKLLYVVGKNDEKYNVAGYSSFTIYNSIVDSFLNEKLKATYEFVLKYNATHPAVLLSRTTPEKIVFLQLLHSFEKRNSDLNNFLFHIAQDFVITDPIEFKNWVDISFDFPPTKILNMFNYIATEKIYLPKNFSQQIVHLSEKYKVFENAASKGDNEVVRWLLENGLYINDIGGSIFERVWQNGQVNIVTLIMGHGKIKYLNIRKESVNKLFNNNETLLHVAVRFGFKDVVDFLVRDLNANINSKDIFGRSPLYRAVESNNSEMVKILITLGGDTEREGLLNLAIIKGHLETVKVLVKLNVPRDMKGNNGQNLMFLAVEKNNVEILEVLASTVEGKENLNSTNNFRDTLVHIASSKGFIESIIVLQRLGVECDSRNNYGQTPLYKAVENGNLVVIQKLIATGADINTKTDLHDTLMHLTASCGDIDIAKLLIKHNIKINEKNSLGQIPVYKAAQLGKNEMMSFLISAGADLFVTNNGLTMLHEAATEGNENAVIMLADKGFDNIDVKGLWGVTPLHLAAGHGHFKIVEILLKKGADPNAQNKELWTPLHRAAIGGYDNIVKLLLAYSANPDLENAEGQTPIQLAIEHGKDNVIVVLQRYYNNIKIDQRAI